MKHKLNIIVYLIIIFFLAQLIGLAIINEYIDIKKTAETGETVIIEEQYNITGVQPPEIQNESTSFVYIVVAVIVGTALVLLIIKFKKRALWKIWFFFAVTLCLLVAFAPFFYKIFIKLTTEYNITLPLTLLIAAVFAYYKIYKQNIYVHNFTELFVYGGLAALLVPVINLISVVILLILISIYDAYAVWRSKHMVTMAKFQTESKIFAGLMLPYKTIGRERVAKKKTIRHKQVEETRTAILGGGDVAFPLLFSGVIMKMTGSYLNPFITTITATIAIFALLMLGQKDKFYPAMPFITVGCFVGYGIVLLLSLI